MPQRTRIISIIPYKILPAQLGGEKGIALFNKYLADHVEITGIATQNNDPSYATNYQLLNILADGKSKYANPFLYFRIRKSILENKASHLLIEHPYFGWLAWLIKRTMDITWVVHSHNIEYMRSKSIGRWWWKALMWYERWVYKNADVVFFISEDDKKHAVEFLGIERAKSTAITYGIEQSAIPPDIDQAKSLIRSKHGIATDEKILLFNGALYHHTNYDALKVILDIINPVLLQNQLRYKIVVCGKGLPDFFNGLDSYSDKNIIYAGFVDDISIYFKAADVFLNPIISGGGVKTKAIEAIAMDCTVISTEIGALGLIREACGKKLSVLQDQDWPNFTEQVIAALNNNDHTPQAFFDYYYWGNIAKKVADILESTAPDA
ncbi:MAG: glycosyltransferase [Chitinophagaceae bacterium]|nr:MAG: glycosyltransferase [Chitinophagaceae bacterium]